MWASIIPGSTVDPDRSMTVAPAGATEADQAVIRSIRLPATTMAWSRRGVAEVPSISVPARITVTGAGLATNRAAAAPAATEARRAVRPNIIR